MSRYYKVEQPLDYHRVGCPVEDVTEEIEILRADLKAARQSAENIKLHAAEENSQLRATIETLTEELQEERVRSWRQAVRLARIDELRACQTCGATESHAIVQGRRMRHERDKAKVELKYVRGVVKEAEYVVDEHRNNGYLGDSDLYDLFSKVDQLREMRTAQKEGKNS